MSIANREDALTVLRALLPQLRQLGVGHLALFGSFARNEMTAQSDIDVLIELGPGPERFRRHLAVADLLELSTGRRVDVILTTTVQPRTRRMMEQEQVLVA